MHHLFTVTKHDEKKSLLQGRESTIYCEMPLFGLFSYDLKWVSIIGIK